LYVYICVNCIKLFSESLENRENRERAYIRHR